MHSLVWILGRKCNWTQFIENKNSRALFANGEQNRDMITTFLWPTLKKLEMEGMYLDQL